MVCRANEVFSEVIMSLLVVFCNYFPEETEHRGFSFRQKFDKLVFGLYIIKCAVKLQEWQLKD